METFHNTSVNVSSNESVSRESDERTYEVAVRMRYLTAALVLSWIYTVLIIVLNTAVIVAIWRYNKRSRLYFLLLNMAVADLMTGVLDTLPHSVTRSIGQYMGIMSMVWPFGMVACKIQKAIANTACMASNYILAATSIDRALVICRPMASFRRKGNKLQKGLVAGCWCFSLAMCSVYIKEMDVFTVQGVTVCGLDMIHNGNIRSFKIYLNLYFIFFFAIPFLSIVVSYTCLVIVVYRRASAPSNSVRNKNETGNLSHVFNKGLPRTKRKSIKLTLGIIVGFLFAWVTYFGFMFRQVYGGTFYNVDILFVVSYFWNSIMNPVAFFIFHKRKARTSSQSLFYTSETKTSEMSINSRNLSSLSKV